jgi:hypothetical protein
MYVRHLPEVLDRFICPCGDGQNRLDVDSQGFPLTEFVDAIASLLVAPIHGNSQCQGPPIYEAKY